MKNFLLFGILATSLLGCKLAQPRNLLREIFLPRITQRHPGNPHALFIEGKEYLAQGNPRKAASRFRSALRAQPGFVEARLGLAHACRENEDYRDARKQYRGVLEASPENVQALLGLAVAESHLGRADEAEQLLLQALKLEPRSVTALNAMADFYYGEMQYQKALDYWTQSLRVDRGQQKIRSLVEDLQSYVKKYGASPRAR